MRLVDCPEGWEYKDMPGYAPLLLARSRTALLRLRSPGFSTVVACSDSRPTHGTLFDQLTPPDCPYFAGNYRGADRLCLREYRVQVPGDPRVGFEPHLVAGFMRDLAVLITNGVGALDAGAPRGPSTRRPHRRQ